MTDEKITMAELADKVCEFRSMSNIYPGTADNWTLLYSVRVINQNGIQARNICKSTHYEPYRQKLKELLGEHSKYFESMLGVLIHSLIYKLDEATLRAVIGLVYKPGDIIELSINRGIDNVAQQTQRPTYYIYH